MLEATNLDNILELKIMLIEQKKKGLIFYRGNVGELPFDQPFEFYFYATKGTLQYRNAFPVPINQFRTLTQSRDFKKKIISYFQSYYETDNVPSEEYFENLYSYRSAKYIWVYQKGASYNA